MRMPPGVVTSVGVGTGSEVGAEGEGSRGSVGAGGLVGVAEVPQPTSITITASNAIRVCFFDMACLLWNWAGLYHWKKWSAKAGTGGPRGEWREVQLSWRQVQALPPAKERD